MAARALLDETFEAIVFEWVGTAVADLHALTGPLWRRLALLSASGVHLFALCDESIGSIAGQLGSGLRGTGGLHLCCDQGSEVFEVTVHGVQRRFHLEVTGEKASALDRVTSRAIEELRNRGFDAWLVAEEPARRRIGLFHGAAGEARARPGAAEASFVVHRSEASDEIEPPADVVEVVLKSADASGLGGVRVTGNDRFLDLALADETDSARFAASWLGEHGVAGRLVLVVGSDPVAPEGRRGSMAEAWAGELERARLVSVGGEPGGADAGVLRLGGGPPRFLELLDEQLERRRARRVPQCDDDPRWTVVLPEDPSARRVAESLGALGNGMAGTRAVREDAVPDHRTAFAVAGAYRDDGRLLGAPDWAVLSWQPSRASSGRRWVDLRTGTLARRDDGGGLRSVRFVSAATPWAMAMRAEKPGARAGAEVDEATPSGGAPGLVVTAAGDEAIAVASRDRATRSRGRTAIERLAAWDAGAPGSTLESRARRRLAEVESTGFDEVLARHRAAWARRWADADVAIEGGAEARSDELAARFAVFHLLAAAAEGRESAVGARGLTGDAYEGHVFWDADVFVLPALAAIRPGAARAMLGYRVHRLPAARAAAAAAGRAGARFPWESAADGRDVTPRLVRGAHGEPIPIRSGQHEEHITADVAWAASHYASWTGDERYVTAGPGRDLVVETARYWASRIRTDERGAGHVYGVMGPDEYHEVVDDDAFTNAMARWNLEEGARLVELGGGPGAPAEAARWRAIAASLVDGWTPARGIYEQFAGYFSLEPLAVAAFARPPVVIDMVLGQRRVAASQLIKQPDVLMLHHLLPHAVVQGSLGACIDFYEPRTAHGSSLSPAIAASVLARARRPDAALEQYRIAARIDLDDLTGTTARGLHLAAMGGLWQALAFGFLGLRAEGANLVVDPRLPEAWSALSMRLRFRGRRFRVRATHHDVRIVADAPASVRVPGHDGGAVHPAGVVLALGATPSSERSEP